MLCRYTNSKRILVTWDRPLSPTLPHLVQWTQPQCGRRAALSELRGSPRAVQRGQACSRAPRQGHEQCVSPFAFHLSPHTSIRARFWPPKLKNRVLTTRLSLFRRFERSIPHPALQPQKATLASHLRLLRPPRPPIRRHHHLCRLLLSLKRKRRNRL